MTIDPEGGLNCFQVLSHLSDLIDDELQPPLLDQVRAHVAGCGNCARFGGAVAAVVQGLRRGLATDGKFDGNIAARLDAAWRAGR